MAIDRIVSFLPSATELLYEFGVQDSLYGVTHECKYPPDAALKPHVISSVIKSDELTSKEIDTMTCQILKDGKDIFVIHENNLKKADPDLIISQETCEVCAAYTDQVSKAVKILGKKPILHSMDPHNMKEIIASVIKLGEILERKEKAKEIVNSLEKRIGNIRKVKSEKIPKVLAIEWIEPFFTAGHWVPEMIETAGGINMISRTGEHSRRLDMDEIVKSNPDVIILMPCGFDTRRTVAEYEKFLKNKEGWKDLEAVKNNQIFAVDANSFFSKPSIRTVEGIEILAKIIQPEKFKDLRVSDTSFEQIVNKIT
ncbi:MAG: cobalamin-binding protein [Nitrosopumilus sp.]|nr:cobalamin-binding protein [Nitrosopumilus sp.]MDF2423514.1 cobalamin-binding protein [Nitrosopumilus sp.]MDF2424108.1 cobalamin-binding protein [Nitrosopumilus sp.]MDF2425008.1 cobalamin-binding protein [Nitrosopumilus sp.]MDF2427450.1 cobalamin-binding protein [Nitrosopumilus sp.]